MLSTNNTPLYFFYLLISSVLISCSESINNPIDHFSESLTEKISVTKQISLEEFDILKPVRALRMNSSSYMIQDGQRKDIFNFVNSNSKKIAKGGCFGNGPQEFTSIGNIQKQGDNVIVYDISHKRLSKIEVLSDNVLTMQEMRNIDTKNTLFMTHCIDSNLIASGIFKDYWLMHMGKDDTICSTIDFPYFDELKNTPPMQKSILYLSTLIANSPNKKKIVAVTQKHGVIAFLNYNDNQLLKSYKQLKYYAPKFQILEGGNIAFSKDNKTGFCSVDCDDTYVYTLYSGRTSNEHGMLNHHCENLLVYDWEGNPIKRYLLDTPLYSMQYDKKNHIIYGIAYNPEGVLVEYQL
jgi:hypothetical protein